jgi:hypothetical protein
MRNIINTMAGTIREILAIRQNIGLALVTRGLHVVDLSRQLFARLIGRQTTYALVPACTKRVAVSRAQQVTHLSGLRQDWRPVWQGDASGRS